MRWRIVGTVLALLLLWVLAAAQVQTDSECPSPYKTDEQLLQIATHEAVHEIREAAAQVFAVRFTIEFLKSFKTGQFFSLDYLEDLERSPSAELRANVPFNPLEFFYLKALATGQLTLEDLIAGIATGETFQLRLARAVTVVYSLFGSKVMGLSLEEMAAQEEASYRELAEGGFESSEESSFTEHERAAILEFYPAVEELLRGETVEIWGYRFDGVLPAIRGTFFMLAYLIAVPRLGFTEEEILQLHSPEEWLELAGEGATRELRSLATFVYFIYFRPQELEELERLATEGKSPELRYLAAYSFMKRLFEERKPTPEELLDWTVHGRSAELRQVAACSLRFEFWSACLEGEEIAGQQVTPEWLYELAITGETEQLRWAAGAALGQCWTARLEESRFISKPGQGLQISDIPRRSRAEPHSLEQALVIYATENTVIHPEAAQAAIPVLTVLYGMPETNVIFVGPGGD